MRLYDNDHEISALYDHCVVETFVNDLSNDRKLVYKAAPDQLELQQAWSLFDNVATVWRFGGARPKPSCRNHGAFSASTHHPVQQPYCAGFCRQRDFTSGNQVFEIFLFEKKMSAKDPLHVLYYIKMAFLF